MAFPSRPSRPSRRPPTVADGLTARCLPQYALAVTAAVVPVGVLGLFAVTGRQGLATFVVVSALLFAAAQTVLSYLVEGRRSAVDRLCTALMYLAFAAAALPLLLIVGYTVRQGLKVVDLGFLTHSMFRINPEKPGGGVYHAIVGTLVQALLAAAMATPVGLLAAIYLAEYGGGRRFARLVSFVVDVMAGVPSIVAGLFVFTAWVLVFGFQKSGFAGAMALFVIMLPVVIRSADEMLRLVPDELREAAYALGIPRWRTILHVVLPAALGGIVTGVMLGVARVAGETAPLLLLVSLNQRIEFNPFAGQTAQRPQETLPTLIFEQFGVAAGNADSPPFQRAWGAALVLIVLIGLLNLVARFVARYARVSR